MANSEQINELAAALVLAQAEFETVSKDASNPFFKSKYADLPEVVKTAAPVLAKHGLAVSQFLSHDDQGDTLTTWLIHKSGQYINDTMRLHLTKDDPQGQGSATTYARRYSYMAALGLVADIDDDGNAASRPKPQVAKGNDMFPREMRAVLNDEVPQKPVEAPQATSWAKEATLSPEHQKELIDLVKKQHGMTTNKQASDYLDLQTSLDSFTQVPESGFETFKKRVIASGFTS